MVLEDLLAPIEDLLDKGEAAVAFLRQIKLTYKKKDLVRGKEKERLTLHAKYFEQLSFIPGLLLNLADGDSHPSPAFLPRS